MLRSKLNSAWGIVLYEGKKWFIDIVDLYSHLNSSFLLPDSCKVRVYGHVLPPSSDREITSGLRAEWVGLYTMAMLPLCRTVACIHTHTHTTCAHSHMYTHTTTHARTHTHTQSHIHTRADRHTHTYTRPHTSARAHTQPHIHAHTHTYAHARAHTHIAIHDLGL